MRFIVCSLDWNLYQPRTVFSRAVTLIPRKPCPQLSFILLESLCYTGSIDHLFYARRKRVVSPNKTKLDVTQLVHGRTTLTSGSGTMIGTPSGLHFVIKSLEKFHARIKIAFGGNSTSALGCLTKMCFPGV